MKGLLFAPPLLLSLGIAEAQIIPPPSLGTASNPGGLAGQVQVNLGGISFGGITVNGDCALNTTTGAIVCTKTDGTAFGSAATKAATASGATVASVAGTFTPGHLATFADANGTIQDGGAPVSIRTSLGAAGSGANSDITSLGGLTTPLPISEGGTGATTAAAALVAFGAAPLANPAFTGTPTAPTLQLTGSFALGTGLMGYVADSTHVCLGGSIFPALASAPTLALATGITATVLTGGGSVIAATPAISAQATTPNGFVACISGFSGLAPANLAVGATDFIKVQ